MLVAAQAGETCTTCGRPAAFADYEAGFATCIPCEKRYQRALENEPQRCRECGAEYFQRADGSWDAFHAEGGCSQFRFHDED